MTGLPILLERLVRLSVGVAGNDWQAVEAILRELADSPYDPIAVDEAVLQLYLFVGYPATLKTAGLWRDISGRVPPDPDPGAHPTTLDAWHARGEEVCREVYGTAYEQLRSNIADLHPALDRWMVLEGYGKVLGRPGLDLGQRELCIIGVLAAGGWRQQLHSHLRGALRCGVPEEWAGQALEIGLGSANADSAGELRQMWSEVRVSIKREPHVH